MQKATDLERSAVESSRRKVSLQLLFLRLLRVFFFPPGAKVLVLFVSLLLVFVLSDRYTPRQANLYAFQNGKVG